MKKTTNEIRNMFLEFFTKKKHKIIAGSTLIPKNDSSLLFTNAGMNQFKNIFLEKEHTNKIKVVTIQNCLRTGGKHNDFDNIGNTPYHHTFFEMLGNFSFGDYFKKESILYAWELLTSPKWFHLDKNKILVTVHRKDYETYNIWKEIIKISPNSIIKIGNSKKFEDNCDNFWQMGETGPCGPSTEIFYSKNTTLNKLPITLDTFKKNYIEIWNIVFIQFNRILNRSLIPLSKLSVDTGMGLERISSIIQKVNSSYDIDLFQLIIQKILSLSNTNNPNIKSLRIVADHIRSSAFIIFEDIIPSNEKRGYILRKIIRRAMLHGLKLKIEIPFLYKIIPSFIQSMIFNNKNLTNNQKKIQQIIKSEEVNFSYTLKKGLKQLKLKIKNKKNSILDGKTAFFLYDTFGFPIDLTKDICQEKNIELDVVGFLKEMKKQKKRSSKNSQFTINYNDYYTSYDKSVFKGYKLTETKGIVQTIYQKQKKTNILLCKQKGDIILTQTTLYGESGGQVGDTGILYNDTTIFNVTNTKKYAKAIIHEGYLIKGNICINDCLISKINLNRRSLIESNHTATHLLNASLKKVLGENVTQKGSFINEQYLRFDFSYTQPISITILNKIEWIINKQIQKNIVLNIKHMTLQEANEQGIFGLEHKVYTKNVRIVSINNFSHELCGGTHCKKTGEIGFFKITSNAIKVSSGVYRINAVTRMLAIETIHNQEKIIYSICDLLNSRKTSIIKSIQQVIKNNISLKERIKMLEIENNSKLLNELKEKIVIIKEKKIIIQILKNKNIKLLRNLIDKIKNELNALIIILINIKYNKTSVIIYVNKNLFKQINAIDLVNFVLIDINGKGGGTPELAEGGGGEIKNTNNFLKKIYSWITSKL